MEASACFVAFGNQPGVRLELANRVAGAEHEYEYTQPDGSMWTKTINVIDPGMTDLESP